MPPSNPTAPPLGIPSKPTAPVVSQPSDDAPKVLDRAFFIARSQKSFTPATLPVPEWGGSVCVRRLRAGEYDRYLADRGEFKTEIRAVTLAHALSDAGGSQLFDAKSAADRKYLGDLDMEGSERVCDEFFKVNGLARGN